MTSDSNSSAPNPAPAQSGDNSGNLGNLGSEAAQITQISESSPPSRPSFGGEKGAAEQSSARGLRGGSSGLPVFEILLIYVLLLGAFFRLTPYTEKGNPKLQWGILWGEGQWLHPDERFLLFVGGDISPMKEVPVEANNPDGPKKKVWSNLSDYFNTGKSNLNPNNKGYNFFVYGTLPIFLTRYITEVAFNHRVGWNEIASVGRPLSALSDLLVILLVYLAASRLFNKRVGLLAAVFYSWAVLPIQLSHFYKEDTFTNFFTFLAIYFAILVSTGSWRKAGSGRFLRRKSEFAAPEADWEGVGDAGEEFTRLGGEDHAGNGVVSNGGAVRYYPISILDFISQPLFLYSLGFGIALGCAMASKVLAAPVAVMLPVAFAVRLFTLPPEERRLRWGDAALLIIIAAIASLLAFRIFQPYAFKGPSFFGVGINKAWLEAILSQRGQTDFPPAMQWARRPFTFALKNLTVWGLGTPLGLLAWAGFLWAGWRMLKGEWQRLALPWVWTIGYFGFQMWQSHFNPSMRYFLPMYPTLVIFAAWLLVWMYDMHRAAQRQNLPSRLSSFARSPSPQVVEGEKPGNLVVLSSGAAQNNQISDLHPLSRPGFGGEKGGRGDERGKYSPWLRAAAILVGAFVLIYTLLYAYSFSRLYTRPITRLEASRWIYQNVPGPIVMHIATDAGQANQPMPVPAYYFISKVAPYDGAFEARQDGSLTQVTLNNLEWLSTSTQTVLMTLTVSGPEGAATSAGLSLEPSQGGPENRQDYTLSFAAPLELKKGILYQVKLTLSGAEVSFSLAGDMVANEGDWDDGIPYPIDGYSFSGTYPTRVDSLEQYYTSQGVSITDVNTLSTPNFNMYWEEMDDKKFQRFIRILDASEYIFITSNRQWGSLPRIPERFPMTTLYYRNLLGCPPGDDIVWCYSVAKPGTYQGSLGFDLVKTFTSEPSIGPFKLNDQFAEEAFTVYDHPKVLIFRKTPAYDSPKVAALLGSVDWTKTIHVFPNKAGSYPADLMLPAERLEEQQQGGTWSDIFNPDAIQNRVQVLGLVLWYACLFLLGLMTYPLLRLALRGLPDRGYPLARTAGLLLLTWLVWVAGSARIPFSRLTITLVLLFLALLGGVLGYFQRRELMQEWRTKRKYFLMIEVVALAFFLFDLYIRLRNPDLWHPWKGGERPMDFAYFNAILKSTTFPPYDPWFSGGYLNYYYYGFVFVGVLVKWLGILPAIAYNLILPTLFSLTALGAFSVAYNIYAAYESRRNKEKEKEDGNLDVLQGEALQNIQISKPSFHISMPVKVGLAAAILMVVVGNLGTVGMVVGGLQRLGASGASPEKASITTRIGWLMQGIARGMRGERLPIAQADWYWNPSRVIPAQGDTEPITEFPFFTFLYSDLHAHMMAMPVAFLALAWAVSLVLGKNKSQGRTRGSAPTILGIALSFFLGALASGALYPINLSDRYTYLALGAVAVAYALWRYAEVDRLPVLSALPGFSRRFLLAAAGVLLFVGLNILLYQPYSDWYGQAYGSLETWKGPRTPIGSYLAHWGLFLFILVSWMFWETRDWMAHTPLSAARKLGPFMGWIFTAFCGLVLLMAVQQAFVMGLLGKVYIKWMHLSIVWLVIPLAVWAGVLMLRPRLAEAKRLVLFLTGTGLVITLVVDTVVVRGDVGRMNTVFKFYLQVWALFAVCAAAAFGWLWGTIKDWLPSWRIPWKIVLTGLVISAGLYTLVASWAKMNDRMTPGAPRSLDSMEFMRYSTYDQPNPPEPSVHIDTSRDYRAIRWMQENVQGSPVIVEANTGYNYSWCSRFTMYTGLPSVLGYEWHQMQQRALLPSEREHERLVDIMNFYLTPVPAEALEFLQKYNVRYIILGELERGLFAGSGMQKFSTQDGTLWRQVYPPPGVDPQTETFIYKVMQP